MEGLIDRYDYVLINRLHSVGERPRPGPLLDAGNVTDVHAGVQIAQRSPSAPTDQARYPSQKSSDQPGRRSGLAP